MSLTDLAFILGTGCVTVAMLILLLGFLTRKPAIKRQAPKKDEDFWPNYEPAERNNTQCHNNK